MELDQKTKEEELQAKIDEMRDSISKGKSPDFKKFWQAKKDCLNLFKGELNPYARFEFWKEYLEISQEAKKLKKILDQESDFSKEQLEKALESLEKDIENFTVLLEDQEEVFPKIDILEREEYSPLQKEISLLNIFGQRIVSLRKELLDLKIRVGIKSKLFKKLSLVGNKIFPRKKELTQKISEKFKKDIDIFIEENSSLKKIPFYILKSKIQSLQAIAKILLLDTKTFTATRIALSKLWDKIKSFENQGKEKNFEKILKKVEEFSKNCKRCSLKEAEKHKKNLLHLLKRTALPKEEVDVLKEEIAKAMKDILEEEEKREQKQKKRIKDIEKLKESIKKIVENEKKYNVETLIKKRDNIIEKLKNFSLNKIEKQIFDRLLKPIKDLIVHKKEKALLDLSSDQLQALDKMKKVLSDRKKRRMEIKEQIEKYRKVLGSSGFDFQTAMNHRKMIDLEKERLEKIDVSIKDIEKKMSEIEV